MSAAVTASMSTRASLIETWAVGQSLVQIIEDVQNLHFGERLWTPGDLSGESGNVI
jgi:hypothetical protein